MVRSQTHFSDASSVGNRSQARVDLFPTCLRAFRRRPIGDAWAMPSILNPVLQELGGCASMGKKQQGAVVGGATGAIIGQLDQSCVR